MFEFLCFLDYFEWTSCGRQMPPCALTWSDVAAACALPLTLFAILLLGLAARVGVEGFQHAWLIFKDWVKHDDIRRTRYELEALAMTLPATPPMTPPRSRSLTDQEAEQELEQAPAAEPELPFVPPRAPSRSQLLIERPPSVHSVAGSHHSSRVSHHSSRVSFRSGSSGSNSTITPPRSHAESLSPTHSLVLRPISESSIPESTPSPDSTSSSEHPTTPPAAEDPPARRRRGRN